MKYFIANWKANKNLKEGLLWAKIFIKKFKQQPNINLSKKIIICPPYHLLYPLAKMFKNFKNIFLGTQNLSSFDNGSFTGEIAAVMIKDLVQYSIIGHSERRSYFSETDDQIEKKITQAKKYGIEPILCVRDEKDKIFPQVKIVAYEPTYAIGTGVNESPEKVLSIRKKLKLKPTTIFLYGGSVNENNARQYLIREKINGLLIGNASLEPLQFIRIINSC